MKRLRAVPGNLAVLLCHSRAWLPREESRSFSTNCAVTPARVSGVREESRIPLEDDRADVRVTILCRTQLGST